MRGTGTRHAAIVICAVVALLVASGCSSTPSTGSGSAQNNAASNDVCAGYPPPVPANPHPAPTPYGPPDQGASLIATQNAVVGAAQDPQYSKQAYLCARGSDPAHLEECSKGYWNFFTNPVADSFGCNYMYLRVNNAYWSGLTPMVLNQYGDYLNIKSDGQDAANLNAGPHQTVITDDGNPLFLPAKNAVGATFTVTNGKLDGANVASGLLAAVRQGKGDSGSSRSTPILPVLAADQMTMNCTDGVYTSPNGRWPWTKSTIADVSVAAGTIFWCTATTTNQGTAYVQATLGTPVAGSVPAYVSLNVPTDQQNALRRNPNDGFTLGNIIWPVQLPEVQASTPMNISVPTGNACQDRSGKPSSCLHLWVNSPKKDGNKFTACKIWVTLEIRSPDSQAALAKYGAKGDGQPHISLGVSDSLTGQYAATYCQRAADLNAAIGINPLGQAQSNPDA